jgi:hypothetical protein
MYPRFRQTVLFDTYSTHSARPMARWSTAIDLSTRSNLICSWCFEPRPDEWINWQKCRCPPNGNGPNGGKTITVKSCIPVEGHPEERERVTIMLQSKAKPVYHHGQLLDYANFHWFFICQICRKAARSLDPWRTVYIEKTEIDYEGQRGPITAMRDWIRNRDSREPTFYEENETWSTAVDDNGYDIFGRGEYWSPPPTPPSSPTPRPLSEAPQHDPWDHSGSIRGPADTSSRDHLHVPDQSYVSSCNPQGSNLIPSAIMMREQPDGDASAGQIQRAEAAPLTVSSPEPLARPTPRTLDYWGRIYFNVVRNSMTEEHWRAINADPWQDPPSATSPPSVIALWAQLTFMQLRDDQSGFNRGNSSH